MNNVTKFQQPTSLRDYTGQQMALIQRTVAADCTDDEFNLFVEQARRVGLDPFRKQIYAVVYNKNKPDKRKMAIITGIDGFRAVANRSGTYRPDENEPEIIYKEDLKDPTTNPLGIERAVVTVNKYGPDGKWHAVKGVAYWDEFAPLKEIWEDRKPTGRFELQFGNWRKMPRVMLPKCAEAVAIRKGWPEDLSGIYAPEEMEQMIDITPSQAVDAEAERLRHDRTGTAGSIPIQWEATGPIEYVKVGELADRCIGFAEASESPTEIDWFKNQNEMALRDFWAKSPNDALGVKRAFESAQNK